MEVKQLKDFIGGWFVGNFDPSLHVNEGVEVAFKTYSQGSVEKAHYHKVATELTLITEGFAMFKLHIGTDKETEEVVMPGQIAILQPGEVARFTALTDVKTVVVKFPSVKEDKFVIE